MKFKIEIVCDNAVLQDGQLVDELHLILHRVINDLPNDISVEKPEFSRELRDTNGNTVGTVALNADLIQSDTETETNDFILCEKCQESTHVEGALFVQGKYVCLSCWR